MQQQQQQRNGGAATEALPIRLSAELQREPGDASVAAVRHTKPLLDGASVAAASNHACERLASLQTALAELCRPCSPPRTTPSDSLQKLHSLADRLSLCACHAGAVVNTSTWLRPRAQLAMDAVAMLGEARHYLASCTAASSRCRRLTGLLDAFPSGSSAAKASSLETGSRLLTELLALRHSLPEDAHARRLLFGPTFAELEQQWTDLLRSEASSQLASIGWPATHSNAEVSFADASKVRAVRRSLLLLTMVQCAHLKYTDGAAADKGFDQGQREDEWWGLRLLLDPILDRFDYHFVRTGAATNRLDKPEWCLSFVSRCLHHHVPLLQKLCDAALSRYETFASLSVKEAFASALLLRLRTKLSRVLPELAGHSDLSLFRHCVKQILAFDASLMRHPLALKFRGGVPSQSSSSGYFQSTSEVLTTPSMLRVWLAVEKDAANHHLDLILNVEESPWTPLSKNADRVTTSSADAVLSVVHGITERYSMIPQLMHRLTFAEQLQMRILDVFAERVEHTLEQCLKEISTAGVRSPTVQASLWHNFCGMLNSLDCVRTVLEDDWADRLVFIELQYFARRRDSLPESMTAADLVDEPGFDSEEATGILFDGQTRRMRELVEEFLQLLVKVTLRVFQVASASFRNRGHMYANTVTATQLESVYSNPTSLHEKIGAGLSLSTEICDALSSLSSCLSTVEQHLCPRIFAQFWPAVASAVDRSLFHDVRARFFSELGAEQFIVDVDALFLLFRPYTTDPHGFFPILSDVKSLLQMPRARLRSLVCSSENQNIVDCSQLELSAIGAEEAERFVDGLLASSLSSTG